MELTSNELILIKESSGSQEGLLAHKLFTYFTGPWNHASVCLDTLVHRFILICDVSRSSHDPNG